jgi:hypothetical protein
MLDFPLPEGPMTTRTGRTAAGIATECRKRPTVRLSGLPPIPAWRSPKLAGSRTGAYPSIDEGRPRL